MRCEHCNRCGKCGAFAAVPIREEGEAKLPLPMLRAGMGAAVDIGTTTIVARVYDLSTGRRVHQAAVMNPQRDIAADVMGRISAAMAGRLDELNNRVRAAIWSAVGEYKITEAVMVGNTTMMHLLAGVDPSSFATAPFVAKRLFGETIRLDGVSVRLPRCAHAFFGADAVASLMMSEICNDNAVAMLVDVGTNGEIALWDGKDLRVSSVAAGPAFERAGIAGSELVAKIADALLAGAIDDTGLSKGVLPSGITQDDVRAVQLAKSAICAGIMTLTEKSKVDLGSVKKLVVAGGLGSALDLDKAEAIGLLPAGIKRVTSVRGNLAIEGASAYLLNPKFADKADELSARAVHCEFGGDDVFYHHFVDAMRYDIISSV